MSLFDPLTNFYRIIGIKYLKEVTLDVDAYGLECNINHAYRPNHT